MLDVCAFGEVGGAVADFDGGELLERCGQMAISLLEQAQIEVAAAGLGVKFGLVEVGDEAGSSSLMPCSR